jgi:hypothetical protein
MRSFLLLIIFSVGATAFSCYNPAETKAGTGFAVIELFTSEGCSSCPPADKAVAALLKEHNSNVYVLSYHVDYWNNLGWKDIFSDAHIRRYKENMQKPLKFLRFILRRLL